jgi:hypothetical protein
LDKEGSKEEEVEIQRKKQKADEKINIAYRIIYVTHFADKSPHHTSTGFLRNVARSEITEKVRDIGKGYCPSDTRSGEKKDSYFIVPVKCEQHLTSLI